MEHLKLEPSKEQGLQQLGCFSLKEENKKHKLIFYSAEYIKNLDREDLTQSGESVQHKEESVYLIVRSLKNKNNENKGYKLGTSYITQPSDRSSSWAESSTWSPPSTTPASGQAQSPSPSSG